MKWVFFLLFNITMIFLSGCAGVAPMPSDNYKESDFLKEGAVSPFRSGYGLIAYPTISPNGKYIVSTTGTGDIYLTTLDGTQEKLLYNKDSDQNLKAIYEELPNVEENRYAKKIPILIKGTKFLLKWAEGIREVTDISWSPDGKKIAINVSNGLASVSVVYIIDVDTFQKQIIRLYQTPDAQQNNGKMHNGITWINDNTIAYSYFEDGELYFSRRDLTTDKEELIVKNKIVRAYYSPDEQYILYFTPTDNTYTKFDMWLKDNNTCNKKKILSEQKFSNKGVAWAPDSNSFYYVEEAGVIHNILKEYDILTEKSSVITEADLLTSPYVDSNQKLFFNVNNQIFSVKIK